MSTVMAKFLGWEKRGHPYNNWVDNLRIVGTDEDLKFHSSYDWLLWVCKKFSELDINLPEYTVYIDNINRAILMYDITLLYREMEDALNWYYERENNIYVT